MCICKGKLLQYLVEDGVHVEAGHPYAEMEMMKMVQTLHAPAAGIIYLSKRAPGAVIERGALLARLKLDFEDSVREVHSFSRSIFTLVR